MHDPLYQAILDQPASDAPRLAFADACADPARAAYIRASIARARVHPRSPDAAHFFQQEMAAIRARPPGSKWDTAFDDLLQRDKQRRRLSRATLSEMIIRGFTGGAGGRASDVLALAPELFANFPLERLWLDTESDDAPPPPRELAALPQLARIRTLGLNADTALLAALAASPHTRAITRLQLWRNQWDKLPLDPHAFCHTLIDALDAGFSAVRSLEIRGVPLPPDLLSPLLARAAPFHRLALESAALDPSAAQAIAATPFPALRELWLRDNHLPPAAIAALLNAPGLDDVDDLDVGLNTLDLPTLHSLPNRRGMPHLRFLGVEESLALPVDEDWTDWTGATIGHGTAMRPVAAADIAQKLQLRAPALYDRREGD